MFETAMPAASLASQSVLYHLVFRLDGWLRRWHVIREYSNDPHCIFRIQLGKADRDISLSDGTLAGAGDPIIDLHFWNENLPRMPREGPSIRWATEMRRCVATSLRELAEYLETDKEFRKVGLIRGAAMLCSTRRCDRMAHLCTKLGFEVVAGPAPRNFSDGFHRLGQNILVSLILLALNGSPARSDTLRRARIDLYLSRKLLVSRFGAG